MATVLIVEDDPEMLRFLASVVEGEGHKSVKSTNGETALDLLREGGYDLVILDWMLPGVDGLEVCRRAREFTYVPIVMLTAKDQEVDRIVGLEVGADDYLSKPITTPELRARLRAHLRRALLWQDREAQEKEKIQRGGLTIDPDRFEALLDGKALKLTRLEFDLLYCLAANPGVVRTRERLLELVWHDNEYIVPRGIDVHINRLRNKIEKDPANPKMLLTVHGVGYKFNPAMEERRSKS